MWVNVRNARKKVQWLVNLDSQCLALSLLSLVSSRTGDEYIIHRYVHCQHAQFPQEWDSSPGSPCLHTPESSVPNPRTIQINSAYVCMAFLRTSFWSTPSSIADAGARHLQGGLPEWSRCSPHGWNSSNHTEESGTSLKKGDYAWLWVTMALV
jgi:hypothetical protein